MLSEVTSIDYTSAPTSFGVSTQPLDSAVQKVQTVKRKMEDSGKGDAPTSPSSTMTCSSSSSPKSSDAENRDALKKRIKRVHFKDDTGETALASSPPAAAASSSSTRDDEHQEFRNILGSLSTLASDDNDLKIKCDSFLSGLTKGSEYLRAHRICRQFLGIMDIKTACVFSDKKIGISKTFLEAFDKDTTLEGIDAFLKKQRFVYQFYLPSFTSDVFLALLDIYYGPEVSRIEPELHLPKSVDILKVIELSKTLGLDLEEQVAWFDPAQRADVMRASDLKAKLQGLHDHPEVLPMILQLHRFFDKAAVHSETDRSPIELYQPHSLSNLPPSIAST